MNSGILSNLFKKMFAGAGDDVATKIAGQYSDDAIRNLATSSADDIAAKQGNLIATHQLDADKLAKAASLDGFVQPSMAVVDPSKGTNFLPGSDFGDIVMVSNRNTINPKVASSKAFIGDRDIYSPRFPETSHQLKEDALDSILKQSGAPISKADVRTNIDFERSAVDNLFPSQLYRYQNPQYAKASRFDLRANEDYQKFADDIIGQLKGEEMLNYQTASGNTKSLPITAENANKLMTKDGLVGAERGWSPPPTQAYHSNTKSLKSLDDLYKNRYRLIDNRTGEHTEDAMRNAVADTIADFKQNGISDYDAEGFVTDILTGKKLSADDMAKLDAMHPNVLKRADELREAYKQVPVSYFEAKPRRVVKGDEFHAAYIPDDSSPEVMAHLERLGVKNIQKYLDKGDLDLSLAKLAKEGKRGVSPYVLGTAGAIPTAGVLGNMFSQQPDDNVI